TGTWKLAPPTRRLLTSTMGLAFDSAWVNTSSGSLPPFLAMESKAPYTMRSATDFLPRLMSTLTNLATSPLEYFGSGRISRLGISLRRGIGSSVYESHHQDTKAQRNADLVVVSSWWSLCLDG